MASILDLTKKRDAHIDQRLRNDITIWLNTVRPDARPHAVVVWFLWDGEAILIFSQPEKQKLRNLQHNANVVLAVDNTREGSDPTQLRVQPLCLIQEMRMQRNQAMLRSTVSI